MFFLQQIHCWFVWYFTKIWIDLYYVLWSSVKRTRSLYSEYQCTVYIKLYCIRLVVLKGQIVQLGGGFLIRLYIYPSGFTTQFMRNDVNSEPKWMTILLIFLLKKTLFRRINRYLPVMNENLIAIFALIWMGERCWC